MGFVYANLGSGPSAGGIGWFDFGPGFTLNYGVPVTGLTGTLANGVTVTFDLSLVHVNGVNRTVSAVPAPIPGAYFGSAGYTGLTGFPVLYTSTGAGSTEDNLLMSNIVVKDAQGNPLDNYTVVVADGENTSTGELLRVVTNGANWKLLDTIGATNPPIYNPLGNVVDINGISAPPNAAYVSSTLQPTAVVVATIEPTGADRQGFAFGFAATQVELFKVINGRRFPADQFNLGIAGSNSNIVTTTGAANGLQPIFATLGTAPGTQYLVNEAIAAGSTSALTDYTQTVTVTNITPGGITPPVTALPETVTPALGDVIQYTITNNPNPLVAKTASPAFAQPGDTITYTVSVTNPNVVNPATNVLVTDAPPTGTTYAGNLNVSVPFTGTSPASGITLTSIPAGATATVSFDAIVDSPPGVTTISNTATVSGTGYSYTTPAAQSQLNYVDFSAAGNFTKTASPAGAAPGDTITYTLTLNNTGTVSATNVVLTDNLPAGVTFVPGSLVGATGTPPTLTLANPIPAGGSATVSFQVTVDSGTQGPISNSATVAYNFTLDPANPNGASGTAASTTATTQINVAALTSSKSADKTFAKPGDIITYTITMQNTGNVPANNVVITDNIPAGTTFIAGSLTGATGTPPTLTLLNPVPAGGTSTVTFQVQVNAGANQPLSNTATINFTFTADPANPNGASGSSSATSPDIQVNYASLTSTKTSTPAFADAGSVITYTITLQNTGTASANNVVITDPVPAGTTFVPGSVVGANGTPPTLTIPTVPAGGTVVVSYQVKVGNPISGSGLVQNTATTTYTYTVDPAFPNGASATSVSNTASSQANAAAFSFVKTADKTIAYIGAVITYQMVFTNVGNVPADAVVLTDPIPNGTTLVPGSLTVSAPYSGALPTIQLTNPVAPGASVTVSFKVTVVAVPSPNPIVNTGSLSFTYTVDPAQPDGVTGTATSNSASTTVFRNNFGQQVTDIIESVALEEAALAAIAQAEGAKIQAAVAMGSITQQELLCINKSVNDMMDSIAMLEAILRQKLSAVDCQINGTGAGCM